MSFAVNEYVEETRPGKLSFPDGSTLNFTYKPNAYTPLLEKAVMEARLDPTTTGGDILKANLLPVLVTWDVVNRVKKFRDKKKTEPALDGEGKQVYEDVPVPISAEGLDQIPMQILGDIVRKIGEGVTPGEATDEDSTGSFG